MMNLPIEFEKKMKAFLGNEWHVGGCTFSSKAGYESA